MDGGERSDLGVAQGDEAETGTCSTRWRQRSQTLYSRMSISLVYLVFPFKLSPHLPELGVSTSGWHNVVHDINMNVIQHNTVTIPCSSWYIIHCQTRQKTTKMFQAFGDKRRHRDPDTEISECSKMCFLDTMHLLCNVLRTKILGKGTKIKKTMSLVMKEVYSPVRRSGRWKCCEWTKESAQTISWTSCWVSLLQKLKGRPLENKRKSYQPMLPKMMPFSVDDTFTFAYEKVRVSSFTLENKTDKQRSQLYHLVLANHVLCIDL